MPCPDLAVAADRTRRSLRPTGRFEHLGARADQSEVLIIGDLDQPVENRVMEHPPPVPILLVSRIDGRVVGFEPLFRNRSRGRGEVRADHATGALKQ